MKIELISTKIVSTTDFETFAEPIIASSGIKVVA